MSGSNSSAPDASRADRSGEPIGLTVHTLPAPALPDEAGRRGGRIKMLLILLACAAPVIASYFMVYVVPPSGRGTNYATLIQPTVSLPALNARALDGRPVPLRGLKGQWLLVVVGGGACDAACEKRLYLQRQLREMTGRERDRIDKVWLVTDDAPVAAPLRAALEATPAMQVLRVPHGAVAAWLEPAAGHALEEHVYVVDPMGEWMMRAPPDPDPSKFKRDLDRLLRASASWDTAGR